MQFYFHQLTDCTDLNVMVLDLFFERIISINDGIGTYIVVNKFCQQCFLLMHRVGWRKAKRYVISNK